MKHHPIYQGKECVCVCGGGDLSLTMTGCVRCMWVLIHSHKSHFYLSDMFLIIGKGFPFKKIGNSSLSSDGGKMKFRNDFLFSV